MASKMMMTTAVAASAAKTFDDYNKDAAVAVLGLYTNLKPVDGDTQYKKDQTAVDYTATVCDPADQKLANQVSKLDDGCKTVFKVGQAAIDTCNDVSTDDSNKTLVETTFAGSFTELTGANKDLHLEQQYCRQKQGADATENTKMDMQDLMQKTNYSCWEWMKSEGKDWKQVDVRNDAYQTSVCAAEKADIANSPWGTACKDVSDSTKKAECNAACYDGIKAYYDANAAVKVDDAACKTANDKTATTTKAGSTSNAAALSVAASALVALLM